MGNSSTTLKPPFTDKKTIDYESRVFKLGLSEMQGWRNSMEDASLIYLCKSHKQKEEIIVDDKVKEVNNIDNNDYTTDINKIEQSNEYGNNCKSIYTAADNINNNKIIANSIKTVNNKKKLKNIHRTDYNSQTSSSSSSDNDSTIRNTRHIIVNNNNNNTNNQKDIVLKNNNNADKNKSNNKSDMYKDKISFFGVFDGHGGNLISKFAAENFIEIFKNCFINYENKAINNAQTPSSRLLNKNVKVSNIPRQEHMIDDNNNNNNNINNFNKNVKNNKNSYFKEQAEKNKYNYKKFKLNNNISYLEVIEQVLIQTFLDIDDMLITTTCHNMFKEYKENKRLTLKIENITKLLEDKLNTNTNKSQFISTDTNNNYIKINENVEKITQNINKSSFSSVRSLSSNYYIPTISNSFGYLMGTTANVVCIYNNNLIVANVGDSLAVLYQEGKVVILNTEHKVSIQGEEERVLHSGRKIINGRVDGKLNLTRAIGDLQFKDRKLRPYEQAITAYPEILTYKLDENSEFFVSGCDGIWDCVEPQKYCEYVSSEIKKGVKISQIIAYTQDMILSKTINSPIGTDNMTCMIVKFKAFNDNIEPSND